MILVKTFKWNINNNPTINKSKLIDNLKTKRIDSFLTVRIVSDSELLFIRKIDLHTPKGQNIRKFYTIFNMLSLKIEGVSDELTFKLYMSFKYYFIISLIILGFLNIVVDSRLGSINSIILINIVGASAIALFGFLNAHYYSSKLINIIKQELTKY